jgi:hypothetical protein
MNAWQFCVTLAFALSGVAAIAWIIISANRAHTADLMKEMSELRSDNRALMESLAASVDKPLIFTPIKMEESEGYFDRQQAPQPEEQPIRQY